MGQTRKVTSIRYICEGSVEEHILRMQEQKAAMAELGLNKLSRKELEQQKVSYWKLDNLELQC